VESEISPGKDIFLHPISTGSTAQVLDGFPPFGRQYDVPPHPSCTASYPVPVRWNRVLQSRFLQSIPYGIQPCDLLMLQGTTPAHEGLTPSGIIGILDTRCPCWAHIEWMAVGHKPTVHPSHHRTYGSRIRRFVERTKTALYTSFGFSIIFNKATPDRSRRSLLNFYLLYVRSFISL